MTFKEWCKIPHDYNETIDNRKELPMDILEEHYHPKYDTVSCPHCGCTLSNRAVMAHHYCYVCGGKFGRKDTVCDRCDYYGTDRCDCGDGKRMPKEFDCNGCKYCRANKPHPAEACDTEEGKCDWFELWEGEE